MEKKIILPCLSLFGNSLNKPGYMEEASMDENLIDLWQIASITGVQDEQCCLKTKSTSVLLYKTTAIENSLKTNHCHY